MHDRMAGIQGDHILVNGVVRPQFKVERKQVRFRLLNGSNARIYNLQFSDKRQFIQIASDGGFLESPVSLNQIRLSPGERAEVVVEFGENDDVLLQNEPLPSSGQSSGIMSMMMAAGDKRFNIMRMLSDKPSGDVININAKLATLK